MKQLTLIILSFILLFTGAMNAYAQEAGVTILSPTKEIKLSKGQLYSGTLSVRNRTTGTAIVEVSASDFIVTDTKGTPVFVPASDLSNRFAAASWIELPQRIATIPPKSEKAIPYTIHVPSNATAGGHYFSLIVRNVASDTSKGSSAAINVQVASLFSLIVQGQIVEKAIITNYTVPSFQEYGPIAITASVKNLGDIHIRPTGAVHVTNLFGKEVATFPLPEENIFPDASKDYVFSFTDKLLLGPYTAKLLVTYGQAHQFSLVASHTIWIIPWKVILVFILALVALIMGLLLLKKKINPPADHPPVPPTMPGPTPPQPQ